MTIFQNVNTCPVDRQVFNIILAKHSVDNVVYKKVSLQSKAKLFLFASTGVISGNSVLE